ncbi:MAG TPA: hypothetical protein VGZ22_04290 [Isosphaeraceae bacterium]|jgi:hypothetical protein|nr:hypothetical protein [Isosphaeraceae bacterium]
MFELLSRFNPGELIGLVAVGGGLFCGLTAIVMGVWHANRRLEIVAALKQDMLDRGMSADDIRTVLDSGSKDYQKDYRKHASGLD